MPLDPVIGGALISAGGSLLGGLLGSSGPSKFEKQMARAQFQFQQDFAKQGVRWRVEDAKAAGLHPLFALGYQPTGGSPVQIPAGGPDPMGGALAEAGQSIGRAVAAQQTKEERALQALQMATLMAGLEESDARKQVLLAEAAKLRGDQQGPGLPEGIDVGYGAKTFPLPDAPRLQESEFFNQKWYRVMPDGGERIYTDSLNERRFDRSVQQGVPEAFWKSWHMPGGRQMLLPSTSPGQGVSEAIESMAESKTVMWMVIQENAARFGPGWVDWFDDRYLTGPVDRKVRSTGAAIEGWAASAWKQVVDQWRELSRPR